MIKSLTIVCNFLIAFERMYNAWTRPAERKPIDSVSEIVILVGHKRGNMYMTARHAQGLSSSYMEVSRHLIYIQTAVNAAGVWRIVGFVRSEQCETSYHLCKLIHANL